MGEKSRGLSRTVIVCVCGIVIGVIGSFVITSVLPRFIYADFGLIVFLVLPLLITAIIAFLFTREVIKSLVCGILATILSFVLMIFLALVKLGNI